MSLDALSWAFNLDLPNSGVKLTLLALANFSDENGEAYPSQKAISVKTCLSERAIRRHLLTLEDLGIISRISRKRANGSYTSDRFKLYIGGRFTSGQFCQRPNWPEAENPKSQRPILPAAKLADGQKRPQPAAKLAAPERSLNTTINKLHTTVVNRTTERDEPEPEKRVCVDLIFPSIPEQTRTALTRIIESCAPPDKQAILDEVSGALSNGTCKNPVTFAMALVKALGQGTFYPALGLEVAQKRQQAVEQKKKIDVARQPPKLDPLACHKGQEIIDTIRTRRNRNNVSDGIPEPYPSG
jgi:hypothetical protein